MAHVCHVYKCEVRVPPSMLMCRRHWEMVPRGLRDAVYASFNPQQCRRGGPAPSREWLTAARAALNSVERRERECGRTIAGLDPVTLPRIEDDSEGGE